MTFVLASLAALALPLALRAAPAENGRGVRSAEDCAAALRIPLPNAHITTASAVPSNDSLRAFGQKPYCRVEATVDAETHIVALLPDDWNGRFLMGGGGGYGGIVQNQMERAWSAASTIAALLPAVAGRIMEGRRSRTRALGSNEHRKNGWRWG